MPQNQLEKKLALQNLLQADDFSVALFGRGREMPCYLTNFSKLAQNTFAALVKDQSSLLDQARLNPEVEFTAFLRDSTSFVEGTGVLKVLGHLRQFSKQKGEISKLTRFLKDQQVFVLGDLVLISLEILTFAATTSKRLESAPFRT